MSNSSMRTSWMTNNVIPDSIITNMIRRYVVVSPVAALISKNSLMILNTIKPVARPFTAMVRVKLVVVSGIQVAFKFGTSQVARRYKLKSAYH